jgi:hypothetical protein
MPVRVDILNKNIYDMDYLGSRGVLNEYSSDNNYHKHLKNCMEILILIICERSKYIIN